MAAKQVQTALFKIIERDEDIFLHTLGNAQILIADLMESFERRFEKITQIFNKVKEEDIVCQMPNNIQTLHEEEAEIIQPKIFEENGMDIFQIKNGKLRSLMEIKQETLREIYPEVLMQLKGKGSGSFGIFNTRRRIRNGTLQFLYKNGLISLVKEVCLLKGMTLRNDQDCKVPKLQLKIQELVKTKKDGGIRLKKKWKWKNYNPPC